MNSAFRNRDIHLAALRRGKFSDNARRRANDREQRTRRAIQTNTASIEPSFMEKLRQLVGLGGGHKSHASRLANEHGLSADERASLNLPRVSRRSPRSR